MNKVESEATTISELRAQQAEDYSSQSRQMLSCIPKEGISKKRLDWFEKVANAHVYTYFKALLIQASLRSFEAGTDGSKYYYDFSRAGHELARHIHQYVETDALDELSGIITAADVGNDVQLPVRTWLKRYMNHCFKLVPRHREQIFIRGFVERMRDEK